MAAWSITTATYFAFSEDVLTRLLPAQAELQFGYEDRIAELRTRIDRIAGPPSLIDQEAVRAEARAGFCAVQRPLWRAEAGAMNVSRGHRLGPMPRAFR
jgi:hypothetical protein